MNDPNESSKVNETVATQPVELVYRYTQDDFHQALRARARRTGVGRLRWPLLTAGVILVALEIAFIWGGDGPSAAPVVMGVCMVMSVALIASAPRRQAQALYRLVERHGECRTVVDDSGFRGTTALGEITTGWQAFPRYAETDAVFVLLSPDKKAGSLTVIPKRGAAGPADVDRLRGLLDRYLTRL